MTAIVGGFHDITIIVEVSSVQKGEGLVDCTPFNL